MEQSAHAPPSDAAVISRNMVQLLREITGRGPTKARTTIGRDHVLVMFHDTLTQGERTLVEHGMEGEVAAVRRGYQDVMEDRAKGMISDQLGRAVVGFMSVNHFEPDLAAEVFALEPDEKREDHPQEAEVAG